MDCLNATTSTQMNGSTGNSETVLSSRTDAVSHGESTSLWIYRVALRTNVWRAKGPPCSCWPGRGGAPGDMLRLRVRGGHRRWRGTAGAAAFLRTGLSVGIGEMN